MIIRSRGNTATACSTMELECTLWSAGVKKWAKMVKSSERMLERQESASITSITLEIIAYGAAEMANAIRDP